MNNELKPMDELREIVYKEKTSDNQTDVMEVVKKEEQTLLGAKEIQEVSRKFGEERIKSDLAAEASRIRKRNQDTAETVFQTETRELKLKHLKEQLTRQHKYEMEMLDDDARHTQMLDRRRKLVEKYGYLYSSEPENLITSIDGKGNEYKTPKDFSYSLVVNRFRQLGRNISKLDKPLLQTIKWGLIISALAFGIFLLKKFGIL